MDSVRLVAQLVQCFRDVGLCGSQPQLCNLALLCHALAFGRDCHLANLALAMPLLECRLSRERRVQRLLQNEHVSVPRCYAPLGRQMFAPWSGVEVCLILDRTEIKDEVSVLLLGVAYHKYSLFRLYPGRPDPDRLSRPACPGPCERRRPVTTPV